MTTPYFWSQPLRYMRYASHTSPALFWSVMLGAAGPAVFLASIPLKRALGIAEREMIPQTYPVPNRPRKIPVGFDDE
ncbi:hypothetical protein DFP73DRAFT_551726 [Morchella snyderi]|nr:hypothetical protein DFP73DRAFT_551726 [Morchella snyderi]